MKNNFEERYNPPFGSYRHQLGYYVVRPLDWCIIGKVEQDTGETVIGACNSLLRAETKEDADMIASTFNKYFDLINMIDEIKKYLRDEIGVANRDILRIKNRVSELSGRSNGKTYLANEIVKNNTVIRCFECTLDKINEIEERIKENE